MLLTFNIENIFETKILGMLIVYPHTEFNVPGPVVHYLWLSIKNLNIFFASPSSCYFIVYNQKTTKRTLHIPGRLSLHPICLEHLFADAPCWALSVMGNLKVRNVMMLL